MLSNVDDLVSGRFVQAIVPRPNRPHLRNRPIKTPQNPTSDNTMHLAYLLACTAALFAAAARASGPNDPLATGDSTVPPPTIRERLRQTSPQYTTSPSHGVHKELESIRAHFLPVEPDWHTAPAKKSPVATSAETTPLILAMQDVLDQVKAHGIVAPVDGKSEMACKKTPLGLECQTVGEPTGKQFKNIIAYFVLHKAEGIELKEGSHYRELTQRAYYEPAASKSPTITNYSYNKAPTAFEHSKLYMSIWFVVNGSRTVYFKKEVPLG